FVGHVPGIGRLRRIRNQQSLVAAAKAGTCQSRCPPGQESATLRKSRSLELCRRYSFPSRTRRLRPVRQRSLRSPAIGSGSYNNPVMRRRCLSFLALFFGMVLAVYADSPATDNADGNKQRIEEYRKDKPHYERLRQSLREFLMLPPQR